MNDIVIDTPERFIGRHRDHRISIIYVETQGTYDIDVEDFAHMIIMEMKAEFKSIDDAKEFSVAYIDRILA